MSGSGETEGKERAEVMSGGRVMVSCGISGDKAKRAASSEDRVCCRTLLGLFVGFVVGMFMGSTDVISQTIW